MPDIYEESTEGWVEEVYPAWTILKVLEFGIVLAFNRETGRVYPLPSADFSFGHRLVIRHPTGPKSIARKH